MYCKYLSKSLNGKLRCKISKKIITLDQCSKCLKIDFKKNKGINKVSKKRIFVEKDIYNQILDRDKKCRLADGTCEGALQLHHILYRSERKDLINEPSNCIMLCTKHHRLVHSNKHYWQKKLIELNKKYLQSAKNII